MVEPAGKEQALTLSIIIVSWNVRELLAQCLHSIGAHRSELALEAIVVDSASSDGTPEMVREQFPWVRLEACPDNVGFPRGNNIGLGLARGQYILLLNPDTVVVGDALQTLVAYLQANEGVGVVGPQLLNGDGSVQSSRRRFPTVALGFLESTWLEPYAPASMLRRYYVLDRPDDQVLEVDWVTGAALMTRREVVEEVGGLDEAYFMYFEEPDFCRRVKRAGWRVVYVPQAQVVHYVGKSSEQAVTARHINFHRAKLRYYRKYHGALLAFVMRLYFLLSYLYQLLLELAKALVGHKRALRMQRVRSYWQVLKSGLPPAGY
jgi:GT2 family glycosyltransferase